jgi:hypothetical protein
MKGRDSTTSAVAIDEITHISEIAFGIDMKESSSVPKLL